MVEQSRPTGRSHRLGARLQGDHLVPGGRHRRRATTFRVWRVRSAELTDEPATTPPGFALQRAWQEIVATLDERRGLRHVAALVDQGTVRWLRAHFGAR